MIEDTKKVRVECGFAHHMKCDLFGQSQFLDLSNDRAGQLGIHISIRSPHEGLWAEEAIKVAAIR
jgi:hypothetical protein